MSTLWTPYGEHPVPDPPGQAPAAGPAERAGAGRPPAAAGGAGTVEEPSEAEVAAELEALREQLLATPAAVVVANHAYGLFQLAALHLSAEEPALDEARTAIDALAALVEGMTGRLGDNEATLVEGLAQLRLAFVEVSRRPGG